MISRQLLYLFRSGPSGGGTEKGVCEGGDHLISWRGLPELEGRFSMLLVTHLRLYGGLLCLMRVFDQSCGIETPG